MFFWSEKIKIFLKKRFVHYLLVLALITNSYLWYLIYSFIDFSKKFHVLHYNVYFGIDLIDATQKLFFIPVLGLLVIFLNLVFSYFVYTSKKEFLLPYFLLSAGFFVNLELIFYLIGVIKMEY